MEHDDRAIVALRAVTAAARRGWTRRENSTLPPARMGPSHGRLVHDMVQPGGVFMDRFGDGLGHRFV